MAELGWDETSSRARLIDRVGLYGLLGLENEGPLVGDAAVRYVDGLIQATRDHMSRFRCENDFGLNLCLLSLERHRASLLEED